MNKLITIFIASFLIAGCQQSKNEKSQIENKYDSLKYSGYLDSAVDASIANYSLQDTSKLNDAPVKIISARPVKKEYSNYKDISITYKNVSGKTISAIRFRWYGVNAFNEPADMGVVNGIGSGFTDDLLRNGKTASGEWSILSKDLKKIVKAWPYEVAFEDGTKWSIK